MRHKHYFSQTKMLTSMIQFGYPCPRGGGEAVQASLSCPPPPAHDFGQTVSSVNSYCTIIFKYIVVRDIDIILVKLRCLHPPFSLVTLVRGWGASCPGWFILSPTQDLGQAVSSVNSYCTIILEYLVVRDINIISVKLRCLYPGFSLVTLMRWVADNIKNKYFIALKNN